MKKSTEIITDRRHPITPIFPIIYDPDKITKKGRAIAEPCL
jgi:hypothetical protein